MLLPPSVTCSIKSPLPASQPASQSGQRPSDRWNGFLQVASPSSLASKSAGCDLAFFLCCCCLPYCMRQSIGIAGRPDASLYVHPILLPCKTTFSKLTLVLSTSNGSHRSTLGPQPSRHRRASFIHQDNIFCRYNQCIMISIECKLPYQNQYNYYMWTSITSS